MEEKSDSLSHYQLAAVAHKQKQAKNSEYKEKSKKRLGNIITTKMKTSFIGAISACESHFGFLWGHGKEDSDLTENERALREIWENLRAQILDNGNTQLRATMNELVHYKIEWERYQINIPINNSETDDKENTTNE